MFAFYEGALGKYTHILYVVFLLAITFFLRHHCVTFIAKVLYYFYTSLEATATRTFPWINSNDHPEGDEEKRNYHKIKKMDGQIWTAGFWDV